MDSLLANERLLVIAPHADDETIGCGGLIARTKAAGGKVIAEHESTSVVYGMPASVVRAGLADRVVPLPEIATTVIDLINDGKPGI